MIDEAWSTVTDRSSPILTPQERQVRRTRRSNCLVAYASAFITLNGDYAFRRRCASPYRIRIWHGRAMLMASKCLTSLVPPPVVTAHGCTHRLTLRFFLPFCFVAVWSRFCLSLDDRFAIVAQHVWKSLSGFHSSECWQNLRSFSFNGMNPIMQLSAFCWPNKSMEIERSSPLLAIVSPIIADQDSHILHMWACDLWSLHKQQALAKQHKIESSIFLMEIIALLSPFHFSSSSSPFFLLLLIK